MKEILLAVIVLILLGCFMFFEELLMPMETNIMFSLALILCFFLFTLFIWKENGRDERENFLTMHAGRISYLVGSGILIVAIITQSFSHNIDPWLIYALSGMILSKLFAHLYEMFKK